MAPDDLVPAALRDERKALQPDALPVGRRGFMAGASLATGYALAAGPVAAQTAITTDTQGLAAGMANVRTADGKQMPIYYARPAQGQKFATVIVVQEIFGVHEYIKDTCRRLAKAGYLAVAPELYFRQGDASKVSDIQALLRDIVGKVPDAQVFADIDATVAWAGGSVGKGETARLGITGFCWGGRVVWLYAAHNQNVRAGVAWYGVLTGPTNEFRTRHPLDAVASINAPILGLYGGADQGIPNDTVDRMRDALRAAGKRSEIVLYPDTPHAFHADYRPSYRAAQAQDGWRRLEVWFSRNLV
ncbi:MAG: carboxymethylenebutenolidase [Tagaea sp. CACIAM 22H2]|jgi:carboxymethylenebutenolidase|nr:carboxymethylenebutenolidase [Tagaea sp. CACIAM 22H2]